MEDKGEKKGLEILDVQQEPREFMRSSSPAKAQGENMRNEKMKTQGERTQGERTQGERALEHKRRKRKSQANPWLWLAGLVLNYVIVIVLCILPLKIPAWTTIAVIVLETFLAMCLCQSPIWLHGLVIVVNLVLGFAFSMPVFMLLASEAYLVAIAVIHQESVRK